MKSIQQTAILGVLALLTGCAAPHPATKSTASFTTQTKASQAAITPAQAVAQLKAGNERFVSGHRLHRDLHAQVKQTSAGQYPFASIVNCFDSRTSVELIFDQGLGDVFNARIAGNIVNDDILGSLEFGAKVVGSKVIAVIGHTSCGAVKGACDNVQLDHLTGLLAHIQPAVTAVQTAPGEPRSSKNAPFVEKVAAENVRLAMKTIRDRSPLLKEMMDRGQIQLVGGIYDLETGRVEFFAN